jgi:hypothetical protein
LEEVVQLCDADRLSVAFPLAFPIPYIQNGGTRPSSKISAAISSMDELRLDEVRKCNGRGKKESEDKPPKVCCCERIYYCDKACQQRDWKGGDKEECLEMRKG